MYTSAHSLKRTVCGLRRDAGIYLAATAFCVFFAAVYESLSHEVYSAWMIGMFAVPLVAGAIPSLVLLRAWSGGAPAARLAEDAVAARKLWGSAVLALTLGCCFSGVLEIYGTTSPYVSVYWLVSAVLAAAAVVALARRAALRRLPLGPTGD